MELERSAGGVPRGSPGCRSVRSVLAAIAWAAGIAGAASPALAQEPWPSRPISLVVPFTVGSQPDLLARALAEPLSKSLGRPIVILNREGASGTIAVDSVAQARPDGYTLGFGPQGQFSVQTYLRRNLRYKAEDFEFLCQSNTGVFLVAAGPGAKFDTLAGLVEAARKEPGKLSFGSAGTATVPHLVGESLAREAGVQFNHVPFRNVGDLYTQVIAGTVDFALTTPTFLTFRKDVKPLAVVGEQRLAAYPDIPTLKELGYRRSTFPGILGVYAPRGLPAAVSATLRKACPGAVASEGFRQVSEKASLPVAYADAPEYTAAVMQDVRDMVELLGALGMKPE